MSLDLCVSSPLFSALIVLLISLFCVSAWRKNHNLPPGPYGWPIIGYYPYIKEPWKDLMAISKVYGKVFSLNVGGRLLIILNGAKAVKEVLVNRADEFDGRPHGSNLVSWVSDGVGVTQEEGEIWKDHRKFFLQSAKNFGFGKMEMEPKIHDEIKSMLQNLRKLNDKEANMMNNIGYAMNCIISDILLSKRFNKVEFTETILPEMTKVVKLFVASRNVLVGPMLDIDMFFSSGLRAAQKAKNFLRNMMNDLVHNHVKTFDPNHLKDYVDAYLLQMKQLLQSEKSEGSFTFERMEANVFNLITEGTESVSFTVTGLLSEISKHTHVQRAIQAELDTVIGRERLPSWADRQNTPYLEATIQEAFRLAAPFQISTMYSNFEETTIDGYRIPKRSVIIANYASVHHDEKLYPSSFKFDPKRFLGPDGKRVKKEGPYPYGVGKRSCLGESLAQMEVYLVVGSILQSFTLQPGKDSENLHIKLRN